VIAYLRKIRLEEANLRRAFPHDYEEYCRQTRALAPWIF
jgi:protein-S-isoprenylcysteine O-methyltransferase Ste14